METLCGEISGAILQNNPLVLSGGAVPALSIRALYLVLSPTFWHAYEFGLLYLFARVTAYIAPLSAALE